MKRRALLGSLAAGGCGAVAGCEGLSNNRDQEQKDQPSESESSNQQSESQWEQLREEFGFEERLNAVEDLGWDPEGEKPIDFWLSQSLDRDALVEIPPGEYKIADSISIDEVSNWGLLGLGAERRDVRFVTTESSRIKFSVRDGTDLLFENFTFDQGRKFDRSIGMTLVIDDNLRIRNVEKAGANPTSEPNGVSALILNVINPDGEALVDTFVRKGPQVFEEYPNNELCVFSGREHEGTITYRNLDIRNAGENGLYASKCAGNIQVEGGFYKNNRNDGIRISGEGSYIKDAEILIDLDDYHPKNRTIAKGNMRGIRMQSGDKGLTGGLIENTSLELRSTFRTQSLVHIAHNQGGMVLRDSELKNWTDHFSFRAISPSDHVDKPWDITLENVQITEYGRTGSALKIDGRPSSTLRNVNIETTPEFGLRHGVTVADSTGTTFEDVTIETTGIPLRIERPSGSFDDYALEFRGTNEFSSRGNFGLSSSSTELPIGDDGRVFPFQDVSDDVSAILVTGAEEDRLSFRQVFE